MKKIPIQSGGADKAADNMKKKILEAVDSISVLGNKYYVSPTGCDKNDGLSPERPIKSYKQIAELDLKENDSVLFERNGVFRTDGMIWLKNGVSYGAYGSGKKPLILGSVRNYADFSIWSETENGIWKTTLKNAVPSIITFDNDSYIGCQKYSIDDICEDGDFFFNNEEFVLYLKFGGGNPGNAFSDIEIGTADNAGRSHFNHDIVVENLCFKYFCVGAFNFAESRDITVSNCVFGWSGGRIFDIDAVRKIPSRYGNAIEFWHLAENVTVKSCYIYQQFDAALTFQGFGEETPCFKNIRFEENLIEYCSMNIEFWTRNGDDGDIAHISDILYKGNIVRFGGYGWAGKQRFNKENQALLLGWNYHYDDLSSFVIQDNIFDCADSYMIYTLSPSNQEGLKVTKNSYYQKVPSGIHKFTEIIKGTDYKATDEQRLKEAILTFDENPKIVKWIDS